MNTNSNTYTVIYSIILVVIVAAVLAFAAMFLKPIQDANVKKDTISQILTAATVEAGDDILATYQQEIEAAILVDINGEEVGTLNVADCEVYGNSDLKRQIGADAKALPVYIFKNGITVVPCYGAGLWGPIWGYVGFEGDLKTIKAVCFGHKGETPGLGAKIADEPSFAAAFVGKQVGTGEVLFEVTKPANRQTTDNGVDAISGATITSQALGNTLNQWFGFYQNYLSNNTACCKDACCKDTCCKDECCKDACCKDTSCKDECCKDECCEQECCAEPCCEKACEAAAEEVEPAN